MNSSLKNKNDKEIEREKRLEEQLNFYRKRYGEIPIPPGENKERFLDLVFRDVPFSDRMTVVEKEIMYYEMFRYAWVVPPGMTLAEYFEARLERNEHGNFVPAKETPMMRYLKRKLAKQIEEEEEATRKEEERIKQIKEEAEAMMRKEEK